MFLRSALYSRNVARVTWYVVRLIMLLRSQQVQQELSRFLRLLLHNLLSSCRERVKRLLLFVFALCFRGRKKKLHIYFETIVKFSPRWDGDVFGWDGDVFGVG